MSLDVADAYYDEAALLERQAVTALFGMWARITPGDISGSWAELMPEALAILAAAQTVAAEMADPYLTEMLDDSAITSPEVSPDGMVSDGLDVLLYQPVIGTKQNIAGGMDVVDALRAARSALSTYARTEVADTARLAVATGMAARRHVSGYYRRLRLPSCKRCAILAGRFYKWNRGFKRHRNCDCKHVPTREADDSLRFNPREAIASGQVTNLSRADRKAIVELGANPAQVVNAQQGMYDIGGFKATTVGTTRRAIAGARILARDVERAITGDVSGRTFTNMTFDRYKAAQYAELFRRGKTFTRTTRSGQEQRYSYRYVRTPRPTAQQIIVSAPDRDEAIRLLTNYGYIL